VGNRGGFNRAGSLRREVCEKRGSVVWQGKERSLEGGEKGCCTRKKKDCRAWFMLEKKTRANMIHSDFKLSERMKRTDRYY